MPSLYDQFMAPMPSHVRGLVVPATMNPTTQKNAINPDGSISTVRSMSINVDGLEVLIPTVSPTGKLLSEDEAIREYQRTGRHLGIFRTPEDATNYAQSLHQSEAQRIGPTMRPMPSHMTLGQGLGLK